MDLPGAARDRSLDTLRGLAILFVIIGHYAAYVPLTVLDVPLGTWVYDFGRGGVLLFFLLSGFLIELKGNEHQPATFLTHRLCKIVPAYWGNVVLVFLAGLFVTGFEPFSIRDFLGNLAFLEDTLGVRALSGIYWTLVIEVKFYLVFLVVFYGFRRWFDGLPYAVVAANLGLLLVLGRTSLFLAYLPAFSVGAAIGRWERGVISRAALAGAVAIGLVSVLIAAQNRPITTAVFLAADIALFFALRRSRASWTWLVNLGLISYSLYLYHTTLGFWLFDAFDRAGLPGGWPARLAGVTAVVLGVSALSWRCIEVPISRAGRALPWVRRIA